MRVLVGFSRERSSELVAGECEAIHTGGEVYVTSVIIDSRCGFPSVEGCGKHDESHDVSVEL